MSTTFEVNVQLRTVVCHKCAATYALSERYALEREQRGGTWKCPYCEVCTAYCESELDKTKKLLQQTQSEKARLQFDYDQLDAERRDLERKTIRLKKRVSRGVCPCCNRTFLNLRRHMACKHPETIGKKRPVYTKSE